MAKTDSSKTATSKAKKASSAAATVAKAKTKPPSQVPDHEDRIIQALLLQYKCGKTPKPLNNTQLAKKCVTHERTKGFLDAVKSLVSKGLIAKVEGGSVLTDEGASSAGFVKEDWSKYGTNDELHKAIKASLNPKWKGPQIFDLLVAQGPLTRSEIAKKLGVHDRGHGFNYGLKELKESEFIEMGASKKFRISKNAMLDENDDS